jgi:alkylation response protein AidB-like acyl-CoA dehydrogenase
MTMRTLDAARTTCDAFMPGLLDRLGEVPLRDLEVAGSPAIELFRTHAGPALVIPKVYAGSGAGPMEAVRVVRALAAAAPSLAVATTMHHFSVATLFALADSLKNSGMEWALLEGIATQSLLVSSGFAEGRPGQGILTPTMTATAADGGYLVNGSKKPCSLSRSMDLLTASVELPDAEMAVLLIPKGVEGIAVHPFWSSWALAGAESDEVRLTDVFVQEDLVMRTELGPAGELDELQTTGFLWFELLISASYLGMASALVERLLRAGRGSAAERAAVGVRLESASLLLDGAARMIDAGECDNDALAKTLIARFAVQDALGAAVKDSVELLGGMAFIRDPDVAYLAAVSHALAFHPPSRSSLAQPLVDYFAGHALKIA